MPEFSHNGVVICGAGAAGLTAAIFAAQRGANVTLLERTDKAGKKILMSGGTRCNVLPVQMRLNDYFTDSSVNRMKNIFKSWSIQECKKWFEQETGLQLACEAHSNKWFPVSNSAKEVRDLLLQKALACGVRVVYKSAAEEIKKTDGVWQVTTSAGKVLEAGRIVISTGGYSIPTTGTDGMGHRMMKKAGHKIRPVYPALTPLLGNNTKHHALSGISLEVELNVYEQGRKTYTSERSGFLFTHRGYSGPAILDASHLYIKAVADGNKPPVFRVNWAGIEREWWNKALIGGKGNVISVIKEKLPARVSEMIISEAGLENRRTAELKKEERRNLLTCLTDYELQISGHEGYRKAEVTGGGIPLEELNTTTLESLKVPGVYLCGEILDVFGRIGGFNFYWAWVTGRLAGLSCGAEHGI